jgi:hypothetical protein
MCFFDDSSCTSDFIDHNICVFTIACFLTLVGHLCLIVIVLVSACFITLVGHLCLRVIVLESFPLACKVSIRFGYRIVRARNENNFGMPVHMYNFVSEFSVLS